MSPTSSNPDDIKWWVAVAGLASTALGAFAGMFGIGRKVEHIEGQVKKAVEISEKNEADIEELKAMTAKVENLDDTVRKVLALFTDAEGNQRVMTTYICDKKSASCNLVIAERMKHMAEMFGERIQGVEKLIKAGNDAAVDTILKAIKEK